MYVGRKTGSPTPQIILGGIGVRPNHAYFQEKDDGFIYLKASEEEALENIMINGEKMQEDANTGITEARLFHMDRILFGQNTILVFKYPLMNRKIKQIRAQVRRNNPNFDQEQVEKFARMVLIEEGLINLDDGSKFESEEEETAHRQQLMTVEDYSEEEINEDINGVDWDYAYNEILKIEE